MREIQDIQSAEDFLEYVAIHYDESELHTNRLQILRIYNCLAAGMGITQEDMKRWNAAHRLQ